MTDMRDRPNAPSSEVAQFSARTEQFATDSVGKALTESRRLLMALALASVVVAFVGLVGRADRIAEKAALEAEQTSLHALLNYAEVTLVEVNAELMRLGTGNVFDCRRAYTFVSDAQAIADRQPEVSRAVAIHPPADRSLILKINSSIRDLLESFTQSPGDLFDTRAIAVLPVSNCSDLSLSNIVVLARAAFARPAAIREAIDVYLAAPEEPTAARRLADALTVHAAQLEGDGQLRSRQGNVERLSAELSREVIVGQRIRFREVVPMGNATLGDARQRYLHVVRRLREVDATLSGEVEVSVPALPVNVTLGRLFWIGPALIALTFFASAHTLIRARRLLPAITDPNLRRIVLLSGGFGVEQDPRGMPRLGVIALIVVAIPLLVTAALWWVYSGRLDTGAHIAMGLGIFIAALAAVRFVQAKQALLKPLEAPAESIPAEPASGH